MGNETKTERDADGSCYAHALLRGGGTRPATRVALRRVLRWVIRRVPPPELPREPVQPEQRRRQQRWRIQRSELPGIPVQPEQRWWWRFQWIPLDLLQQPCSKLPGKPVQPEQRRRLWRIWRIWRIPIWEIVDSPHHIQ